ncbi:MULTISPECIES: hypothetical protein [unclassified Lysobacter]|uniref:hypothetical protein n=1 Tax=unclassified Lysobacter TaxID=2635362 RepID=UPI0012FBBE0E|nr:MULTISPECIES: hypothetical protein [unclassified Lysobacter]
MSILNVQLTRHVALIASDTAGRLQDGGSSDWSKLHYLAHANTVIAGRGERLLLFNVLAQSSFANGVQDFDTLLFGMQKRVDSVLTTYLGIADKAVLHPGLTEVAVVGWSAYRGRMTAFLYRMNPVSDTVAISEINPSLLAPNGGWEDVDAPEDSAAMVELARDQVRHTRETFGPDAVIGGRLVIAELTRSGVSIATVGSLD